MYVIPLVNSTSVQELLPLKMQNQTKSWAFSSFKIRPLKIYLCCCGRFDWMARADWTVIGAGLWGHLAAGTRPGDPSWRWRGRRPWSGRAARRRWGAGGAWSAAGRCGRPGGPWGWAGRWVGRRRRRPRAPAGWRAAWWPAGWATRPASWRKSSELNEMLNCRDSKHSRLWQAEKTVKQKKYDLG